MLQNALGRKSQFQHKPKVSALIHPFSLETLTWHSSTSYYDREELNNFLSLISGIRRKYFCVSPFDEKSPMLEYSNYHL
jgi:hypothetical protein